MGRTAGSRVLADERLCENGDRIAAGAFSKNDETVDTVSRHDSIEAIILEPGIKAWRKPRRRTRSDPTLLKGERTCLTLSI